MSRNENVDCAPENKLHTEFSINPFRKIHILPDKPMSRKSTEKLPEDSGFIESYRRTQMEPTKKYLYPITESQEIGWLSTSLSSSVLHDPRFTFRRATTDVTKLALFALQGSNTTQ